MNIFYKVIKNHPSFREMMTAIERGNTPVSLSGVSQVHKAHTIMAAAAELRSPVLVMTEDEPSARRLIDDITGMGGEALLFPAKELTLVRAEGVSREYEYGRIKALSALLTGEPVIICGGAESFMQRTVPPEVLSSAIFSLKQGEEIDQKDLSARLIKAGYTRCDRVDGASQFSVRGAICDIFPVQSDYPVRIEFWGDEIDTIFAFDPESQRRTESMSEIAVSPACEVIFDPETMADRIDSTAKAVRTKKAEQVKEELFRDSEALRAGLSLANIDKYITLAYDSPALIFDYLKSGTVFFCEYRNAADKARTVMSQHEEDVKLLLEQGQLCRALIGYLSPMSELLNAAEKQNTVYLDTFMRSVDTKLKKLISMNAFQAASWSGQLSRLTEDLGNLLQRKYSVILMSGSEKTLTILRDDLIANDIPCDILTENTEPVAGRVVLTAGSLSGGYEYPDCKAALITQTKAEPARRRIAKRHESSERLRSLSDISEGDLVVHARYGIGKYLGIKKHEIDGITKDYITIKYAGSDMLYVPVTQLDMVSRYIGARDDDSVRLGKLSSGEWKKAKARVKTAVKDMAKELIALYAKRQQTPGFAFSPDDEYQRNFEERFDYRETDDQLRSIEEIKADMQSPHPMDRLLCGDVGFGKTEVALRAAFKCVMDSKQCAILVPTTVLAWQHYQTALKRFEQSPVKVELLSRFRTPKEQQQILKDLKRGLIDIIIGTHRLVQKDVEFKSLGLAIIDEEQRFGVAHKEKFKTLFAGVDVLTLSATPIPRTLNMAMSGIRDMSVIEEPPQDRLPVQTYVIEENMDVVATAIARELRRGGQVYYIHNRIETIDLCADKIHRMLPDARIAVAHGKTGEDELSEIWRQLVDREIDILVCTTIIETGVDVSNVNTLIIEDADRLGLSQLYQLRGRVGRSSRRAFAYFMFKKGKSISEVASKRLDAIREFTQFGSGFRIALRDLEIRGAGSLLGGKQHGHMEAVGYDMYIRLLNEAIAEEKGEPIQRAAECLVDIQIEAHIPENYIESPAGRIEAYRKIAAIRTDEDRLDMTDELIDRYGDPPKSILGLMQIAQLRNTAAELGITEIAEQRGRMLFYTDRPTPAQLAALSDEFMGKCSYTEGSRSYIAVEMPKKSDNVGFMYRALMSMKKAEEKQKENKN